MNYIEKPNLPQKPVKLVVVDGRIDVEVEKKLLNMEIKLIKTRAYKGVYEAISYHPDIVIHHIQRNKIVYAPGTNNEFLNELRDFGFELIKGNTSLSLKYPGNVAYNAASVGQVIFHNKKYTDTVLKTELEKEGIEFLDVNQGYTKCSTAIVDEMCIMTSDTGIAYAALDKGMEVLLLQADEGIILPGMTYGFIGGSSGLLDRETLAISGDITRLKSYDLVQRFLSDKGIKTVSLSTHEVVDIGSLIPLMTI